MPASRLSALQRDVVRSFFAREHRFFLTGGGALVGFHLGHRETEDLDLFATEAILEDGLRALVTAAAELGATVERVADHPYIKRCVVRRGSESARVELVLETATQWFPQKREIDGILVDPPEEILANKLVYAAVESRGARPRGRAGVGASGVRHRRRVSGGGPEGRRLDPRATRRGACRMAHRT